MRIIGICRFSYPALGGFKRMHDSIEEREAYLYAPERMKLRFGHFETLTLPSIRAQTHAGFTFLVVTGQNIPSQWLEHLHNITADVPQAKIVQIAPKRQRLAMHDVIQQELAEDDPGSVQFRLDDDDAVAVNFVGSIHRFARKTAPLWRDKKPVAFDFNHGYSVQLSEDGIALREKIGNFLSCGQAAYFPPNSRKSIMSFAHQKMHHQIPTLIVPGAPMFLRACHDDNDSEAKMSPDTPRTLEPSQREMLQTHFNVDEDHVKAVFSA